MASLRSLSLSPCIVSSVIQNVFVTLVRWWLILSSFLPLFRCDLLYRICTYLLSFLQWLPYLSLSISSLALFQSNRFSCCLLPLTRMMCSLILYNADPDGYSNRDYVAIFALEDVRWWLKGRVSTLSPMWTVVDTVVKLWRLVATSSLAIT